MTNFGKENFASKSSEGAKTWKPVLLAKRIIDQYCESVT